MKNLYKILIALIFAMTLIAAGAVVAEGETAKEATIVASGYCGGVNVQWKLDSEGLLTIWGNGRMNTYSYVSSAP